MVTVTKAQSQAIFRAIADPTRREILNLLREGRRRSEKSPAIFAPAVRRFRNTSDCSNRPVLSLRVSVVPPTFAN